VVVSVRCELKFYMKLDVYRVSVCQVNFHCQFEAVCCTVHVTMEMGIPIFRAVTLRCGVSGAQCLEGSRFLHLQGQELFWVV
jgi:hypothetical protein